MIPEEKIGRRPTSAFGFLDARFLRLYRLKGYFPEHPALSETDSIHRRRLRQHRTASTSTDRSKSSSRAFQRCLARPVAPTCWCTAASRSLECHPRRAPTSDPIHFQASQRVASAADFEPTPSALMTSIALHAVTMLSCLQVLTRPPTSTASLQGPYGESCHK